MSATLPPLPTFSLGTEEVRDGTQVHRTYRIASRGTGPHTDFQATTDTVYGVTTLWGQGSGGVWVQLGALRFYADCPAYAAPAPHGMVAGDPMQEAGHRGLVWAPEGDYDAMCAAYMEVLYDTTEVAPPDDLTQVKAAAGTYRAGRGGAWYTVDKCGEGYYTVRWAQGRTNDFCASHGLPRPEYGFYLWAGRLSAAQVAAGVTPIAAWRAAYAARHNPGGVANP